MPNLTAIRVLITDDSAFMRVAIARLIESDPEIEVCGTAVNGRDALQKLAALEPDVITLDVEMPEMNGLETLRRIMARHPRPVIMVSSRTQEGAEISLDALDLGAFDCVAKPASYAALDVARIREELLAKIKAAGQSRRRRRLSPANPQCDRAHVPPAPIATTLPLHPNSKPGLVCIGASTGGPQALHEIIPQLPRDFSAGILIVQHMPVGFTAPLAARLNAASQVEVREARHGDWIEPGLVLIAPAGQHLTVVRSTGARLTVELGHEPAHLLHMPSADVMMQSASAVCGPSVMGVILTGMGADGAQGMQAIRQMGGLCLGQDEASCAVYGMPRACSELGILNRVVPLSQITAEIVRAVHTQRIPTRLLTEPHSSESTRSLPQAALAAVASDKAMRSR